MKRLILSILVLAAATLAARVAHDVFVDAQGAPTSENGDVNGDHARDISDAIYLLSWLFSGGPEPVALAGSPQLEGRVADLEQAVAALQGTSSGVAAAVESLALILGDLDIVHAVPIGALHPLDQPSPLVFYLGGEPFGEVIGAHIVEELSSVPVAHVAVRIQSSVMETDPLLGMPARLDFQQQDRLTHFTGEVIAAGFSGRSGRGGLVRLSIAPRMHRLARTRHSRAFQDMKNSEVVSRILGEHGISPSVVASPITHEYIVQYQESDFDFVSRLMEEEGIYYFFEHGMDGDRVLQAGDSTAAPALTGVFPYRGHQGGPTSPGEPVVLTFTIGTEHPPAAVEVRGWDPVRKQLLTSAQSTGAGGAQYDFFAGQRQVQQDVDSEARARRDRALVDARTVLGTSTISPLRPGFEVAIAGVGGAFDGKYFVTRVRHTMVRTGTAGQGGFLYGNSFQCIPDSVHFRPELRTPRTKIFGVHPAIVTDNKDPDKLARVRVKFPWLQESAGEGSSAWARVVSMGAGKDRGWFTLPEVDDEVLVSFVQGDPHHPIVLGAVWNQVDVPPATNDTGKNDFRFFKSRSGHRLIFDDTDGREKLSLYAVTRDALGELDADGVLLSSVDAGPAAEVHPGERHRDNSIVAWARVSGAGEIVAPASLGVAAVRRLRAGVYDIELSGAARSAAELIPLAVAQVTGPPTTPAAMRVVAVEQQSATRFAVYGSNGLGQPVDADFVFLVTAR